MQHAVHSCGILDNGKIIYGGEASGYVLDLSDCRTVYFAGDTNVVSDMQLIQQLYRPESVFLPIGYLFTMSPREAAAACKMLRPMKVFPCTSARSSPLSGRWDQLRRLLAAGDVWELEPGKPVDW